jgi:Transposase DDE domain
MPTNNKIVRCGQERIQKHIKSNDTYSFFNLLTGPELLSQVEAQLPEHRERSYPPTETLAMFLAQALSPDRSCQKAVNARAVARISAGLPACSTRTGAYCMARQRLPTPMVSTLTRFTGKLIDNNIPDQWRWNGRRVYLVDGTTMTMPDTPENQEAYPQHKGIKTGLGFPICRIVGVISLSSGAILNTAIGRFNGKGSSEQTLLRTMLDTFAKGDLIVGDAFYGTYSLLAAMLEKGVDVVFEQLGARKNSIDFRKGKRLSKNDHLITLSKPKCRPNWMSKEQFSKLPDSMTIRELAVGGKILITTILSDKEAPKHELKSLYKQRWGVELDIRNIKSTLGMETLSCKTPAMCEKEIWVYLLAYNLIRLLMARAALLVNVLPRQLSFKHTLQIWLAWDQSNIGFDDEKIISLFNLIAQCRVGNRGGRIEPRALKKRPKTYPMLMQPREEARELVKKNGHPKKLK